MKPTIIVLSILFVSCKAEWKNDSTEIFIPGTYIRQSQNEYGLIYDTLIISVQNTNAHQFKIESRSKYGRTIDGAKLEAEYKVQESAGLYDHEKNVLQDQHSGMYYSFDEEKQLAFEGANQFHKIK